MKLLNRNSLAETVDAVNEVLFFGKKIPPSQKKEIAEWLASRQGVKGSYWGMIAPTERDFETGIRTFTGEVITTGAGTSHVLGEEASRTLIKLGVKNKTIEKALHGSNQGFEKAMEHAQQTGYFDGYYCCGKCTPAYWRNLTAGGLKNQKKRLEMGMKYLNKMRDGKGRWNRLPYYYTLLALSEIDSPSAKAELEYARQGLEKLVRRAVKGNKYQTRRRKLAEIILDKL